MGWRAGESDGLWFPQQQHAVGRIDGPASLLDAKLLRLRDKSLHLYSGLIGPEVVKIFGAA